MTETQKKDRMRETDRPSDRKTDRQTDRKTDIQTERQTARVREWASKDDLFLFFTTEWRS